MSQSPHIGIGSAAELGIPDHALTAFYQQHWMRAIALEDSTFFKWQFNDAPYSQGRNHCCVATVNGEIAGVMGVTPWPFRLKDAKLNGGMLTTWVVGPNARGLGIGNAMIGWLQQTYDVLAGSGITGDALPIYIKHGFRYLRTIPRYVFITDWQGVKTFSSISERYERILASRKDAPAVLTVAAGTQTAGTKANGFAKDDNFLNWRYQQHPYYTYDIHHIAHNEHQFTIVTREQDVAGQRIMHILDILSEAEDIRPALAFCEEHAVRRKACFIDYMQLHSTHQAALLARGWLSMVDDEFAHVMHLFSPPEMRSPPTTSLILWAKTDDIALQLFDYRTLNLSKSDLDLDRPTMDFITNFA